MGCTTLLLQDGAEARQQLHLEVTMYACRDNATVPSPQCEQQVLAAVVERMVQSAEAQQAWQAAGEPEQMQNLACECG